MKTRMEIKDMPLRSILALGIVYILTFIISIICFAFLMIITLLLLPFVIVIAIARFIFMLIKVAYIILMKLLHLEI